MLPCSYRRATTFEEQVRLVATERQVAELVDDSLAFMDERGIVEAVNTAKGTGLWLIRPPRPRPTCGSRGGCSRHWCSVPWPSFISSPVRSDCTSLPCMRVPPPSGRRPELRWRLYCCSAVAPGRQFL